jgi:hypothetical protein
VADGRGLSLHEVGERDAEGVREEEQVDEVGGAVGVFPSDDRLAVAADALGEFLLGEAGVSTGCADAVSDLPLAGV